jgi:hypothetical protein
MSKTMEEMGFNCSDRSGPVEVWINGNIRVSGCRFSGRTRTARTIVPAENLRGNCNLLTFGSPEAAARAALKKWGDK